MMDVEQLAEETADRFVWFLENVRLPPGLDGPLVEYSGAFGHTRETDGPELYDARLSDLGGFAFHKSVAVRTFSPEEQWPESWPGVGLVSRLRTVTAAQARGATKRFFPQMLQVTTCDILSGGKAVIAGDLIVGRMSPRHPWLAASENCAPVTAELEGFLCAKHLISRYDWRVRLGIDGGCSVTFPTSSESAKDVFRLRDLPSGAKRRTALRNWIRAHTRKRKDGISSDIAAHLRGATRFNWNGLHCELIPSQYDREREALRKSL